MPVIGLTGGIASGKSLVSETLKELGAQVVDADTVAREVVESGSLGWKKVVESFGDDILNPDETVNRKKLGQLVFANPKKLKLLNDITHPLILDKINSEIKKYRDLDTQNVKVMVIDAPLLIETGLHRLADEVWVVDIPEEMQVERLVQRDGMTREEAWSRINSQMPASEKKKLAQVIINNSGKIATTQKTVRDIWKRRFYEVRGGDF